MRDNILCPVCEQYHFEEIDDHSFCPVCDWENDEVQRQDPDFWGGGNELSVNESKLVYKLLKLKSRKIVDQLEIIDEIYERTSSEIYQKFINNKNTVSFEERESVYTQEIEKEHKRYVNELKKLDPDGLDSIH